MCYNETELYGVCFSEYEKNCEKQEKVANALITAEDQAKKIIGCIARYTLLLLFRFGLLNTELLADILGDSVLVNYDVHGLVASECL